MIMLLKISLSMFQLLHQLILIKESNEKFQKDYGFFSESFEIAVNLLFFLFIIYISLCNERILH